MKITIFRYGFMFAALCLVACSSGGFFHPANLPTVDNLPLSHRIDIQQGNVVTQEMVAQLAYGMDKKKVQFIMGTPVIQDTFNADRWDYLYTRQRGRGRIERRLVTLRFEHDLLAAVEGDIVPATGRLVVDVHQDKSVRVPGRYSEGILTRIRNKIPFVKDKSLAGDLPSDEEKEVVVPEDAPEPDEPGFFARIFSRNDDQDDEQNEDTAAAPAATPEEEVDSEQPY